MSISDLELGTVLALTRKAEPDSETMLDSHIRIGANMAAAQQKPLIVKYRASLSSDKTIAQILQNDENVASHRRCAVFALFRFVSLRFVSFRFVSFCFVTFCFVLFCFVLFCFVLFCLLSPPLPLHTIFFFASCRCLPSPVLQPTHPEMVKPKTCTVLGLPDPCLHCRCKRSANRCVRRRDWLLAHQPAPLAKRPHADAILEVDECSPEVFRSNDNQHQYQMSQYVRERCKEPGLQKTLKPATFSTPRKRPRPEQSVAGAASVTSVASAGSPRTAGAASAASVGSPLPDKSGYVDLWGVRE